MSYTIEPNVGARIRAYREEQGLSLRKLAERCQLSINAISQIERGGNSPTVVTLHRLATALNVDITNFFQPETRQMVVFVPHASALTTQMKGIRVESLGLGLTNQQMEPIRMTLAPGVGNPAELVTHSGEEFLHCLEGECECRVGAQVFMLQSGDSLLFRAEQPHTYRNLSSTPAIMLVVFLANHDSHLLKRLHLLSE